MTDLSRTGVKSWGDYTDPWRGVSQPKRKITNEHEWIRIEKCRSSFVFLRGWILRSRPTFSVFFALLSINFLFFVAEDHAAIVVT
jgi:hypothetical protein